jgi:hypothetical protein
MIYTMHQGRRADGSFDKTITYQVVRTLNGWESRPVFVLTNVRRPE